MTPPTAIMFILALGITTSVPVLAQSNAADPPAEPSHITVFENATVLPMDSDRVLHHHTVIVNRDRIMWLGLAADASLPIHANVIDCDGKFLMPGLVDMHVHTWDANDFTLFLANGITTIRNMFGNPQHLGWMTQVAEGTLLAPTIYTAGPIVDGDPPVWPGSHIIKSPEDATRSVESQHGTGYQFIKVYNGLSPESYEAVVDAAGAAGIPVIGHVPDAVGLQAALTAGQHTIEHLTGYVEACYDGEDEPGSAFQNAGQLVEHYNPEKVPGIVNATIAAGTWNCPTLVVLRAFLVPDEQTGRAREGMEYVSDGLIAWWMQRVGSGERLKSIKQLNGLWTEIARQLHAEGANIILGTDTPNPWVVPGFSIHRELANLVEIGMTPYEALEAGTRSAVDCLGAADEFGTIRPGLRADLLLLNANPFEDVSNVRHRAGVMVRGKWLPETEIQAMLASLAKMRGEGGPDHSWDWSTGIPPVGGCCEWHN